ncbi:hypothetical protein TNCV_1843761 [Trichonephila clavipes]|nr:hypothetical protein TNCV_1843761 [Trichonephila clavipes]
MGLRQWRNGEHLDSLANSGFGPPSWILQRVGTWRQSGFEAPRTLPPAIQECTLHHWVKIWAMRWLGKVLENRLMFREPILNTSGTMYNCIIVHEISVVIRVKNATLQDRVHLICHYI